jgi:hypothetical protein
MNCQIPLGRRMMRVTDNLLTFSTMLSLAKLITRNYDTSLCGLNYIFKKAEAVLALRMTSGLFACCW